MAAGSRPTILVSVEDDEHFRWQFALLLWTKRRVWPDADLLLVVSRRPSETRTLIDWRNELGPCGRLIEIPSWKDSQDPSVSDDDCPAYTGILAAEAALPTLEDSAQVILLDPDMILLAEPDLQFGIRLAQERWCLTDQARVRPEIAAAGIDVSGVQAIGLPISATAGDLRGIVNGWRAATASLRARSDLRPKLGGMASTWGFAIAADRAGIRFTPWYATCSLYHPDSLSPIVHYRDRIEMTIHKREGNGSGPFGLHAPLWEILRLYALWDYLGSPPGWDERLPLEG